MTDTSRDVVEFLARYPPSVRDVALDAQRTIRMVMPEARHKVDPSSRVIGYGLGAGYTGLICTIILSKTGVKLGIVRGAELPDPGGLLEGAGKVHRYVMLSTVADVHRPAVKRLLEAAVKSWRARVTNGGNAAKKQGRDRRKSDRGARPREV